MSRCVFVQVACESVPGLYRELDGRTVMDCKWMRLKLADCRDPDETVLARLGPC